MNLKFKAALITAGVLISSSIIAVVLNHLPTWGVGAIALVFVSWIMYKLALTQLEFNEKVDELNEKYKD